MLLLIAVMWLSKSRYSRWLGDSATVVRTVFLHFSRMDLEWSERILLSLLWIIFRVSYFVACLMILYERSVFWFGFFWFIMIWYGQQRVYGALYYTPLSSVFFSLLPIGVFLCNESSDEVERQGKID